VKKGILACAAALMLTGPALAGDQAFIDFAIKHATDRGFHGCDAAIADAFAYAGGEDMRVSSDLFEGLDNSIRITGTYGNPGDAILVDVTIIKSGGKCYSHITTSMVVNKTCTAYMAEMSAFQYQGESPDYLWLQNAGGVDLLLNPVNNACAATFRRSTIF